MAITLKSKKDKKQKTDLKTQGELFISEITRMFSAHGVVIMFVLAGATIGFALVRSRGYLNPVRDEARYTEVSGKDHYSKIDLTLVNKLEASLNRAPISVNTSFAPNRSNPFSE